MKLRKCIRCGERRPCAMAGPNGAWVCDECLLEEAQAEAKAAAS